MKRAIIRIDEEKCNGCGLCVPNCAEGAIQIIDGKAKLIADKLCDGLGACLGHCPQDALHIEEKDTDAFDEAAVHQHLANATKPSAPAHDHAVHGHAGGCPGSRMMTFNRPADAAPVSPAQPMRSELTQWPVQLTLVPPTAPYFQDADILIAADCVPFAYPDFHRKLLRNKALVIACPKLDDVGPYVQKLTTIFRENSINSITIAHMEVPCCFGLGQLVKTALNQAGRTDIPVFDINIGVQGDVKF